MALRPSPAASPNGQLLMSLDEMCAERCAAIWEGRHRMVEGNTGNELPRSAANVRFRSFGPAWIVGTDTGNRDAQGRRFSLVWARRGRPRRDVGEHIEEGEFVLVRLTSRFETC